MDDLADAASDGNIHRVQELLSVGASINEKNRALCWANRYNHAKIVGMLLDADADPNNLETLKWAVRNDQVQIVEMLLSAGANPNDKEALKWAARYDQVQIVEMLLAAGADIKNLPKDRQKQIKYLAPTYISMQEYLILEPLIINIVELKDRFILDVIPNKKYVVLK